MCNIVEIMLNIKNIITEMTTANFTIETVESSSYCSEFVHLFYNGTLYCSIIEQYIDL
ncbi:hypothetical protein ADA01nite_13900 [Aneurinibacillus danicus]|uniref:Uncharacterized protein n=1 Tax=Aneurinibacillus danicus TaxID=267746 RepID=A0A511V4T7_9BACL|nr:hypothetical protein ADA01nite_13900 [Aneurinibacillus danicus]